MFPPLFLLHLTTITTRITIVAKPTARAMYRHQSVNRKTRVEFSAQSNILYLHVFNMSLNQSTSAAQRWMRGAPNIHYLLGLLSSLCSFLLKKKKRMNKWIDWIRSSSWCSVFSHLMMEGWRQTLPLCLHPSLYIWISYRPLSCEQNWILRSSQWLSSQTVMSSDPCCLHPHLYS